MDRILLSGLEARTILGVHDWERAERRLVRVDVEVAFDAEAAAARDEISATVDYAALSRTVQSYVEASRFRLLESLAEGIAGVVRGGFSVPWVRVRVEKPGAVACAEAVAVDIERGKRPA